MKELLAIFVCMGVGWGSAVAFDALESPRRLSQIRFAIGLKDTHTFSEKTSGY